MTQGAAPALRPNRSEQRIRGQAFGLGLSVLVFVVLWFAPFDLDDSQRRLAALFGAVVVLWVTEALPIAVTALLIAPGLVAFGIADAKSAFAPYADPLLFLFVGGFFIARAMSRHALDRRIALRLVTLPGVAGHPARVRLAFMGAAMLLSMWISNTATCAILVPILLGLRNPDASDDSIGDSILAVAYACSLGGLGTLVGSPPNSITVRFLREAGVPFSFVDWMKIGVPVAILLVGITFLVSLRDLPKRDVAQKPVARITAPWSRGERVTALAFGLAVIGWVVPAVMKSAGLEIGATLTAALPGGSVALLAASVLFVFRTKDGARVLPWSDAAKIDWGIIMLFGGGITLGTQMIDTGLAERIAVAFVDGTGIESLIALTIFVTFFTIFFTEVCSNTASATMLVPLVIPIAARMGVAPLAPAMAVGLAASCAFMLPVATGPNAVAYGTGLITTRQMMRKGLVLNLLCGVAICVIVLAVFG